MDFEKSRIPKGIDDVFSKMDGAKTGEEMNHLSYNPTDYPEIYDMLSSHQFNSKEIKGIDLMELAKNGKVVQDSFETYLKDKSNSSSALKEILKTPFHYRYNLELKPELPTPAHFELGTFAHQAFIEPEQFGKVIIGPEGSLAKTDDVKAMIRWYEKQNKVEVSALSHMENAKLPDLKAYLKQLQEACPYTIISADHQHIVDCLQFNYNNYGGGLLPKLLKGALGETSFYGKDPDTGLKVKVRPDFLNIEENIGVNAVISMKTTAATSLSKFIYDTAKFQYELSEGMYQEVISQVTGRKFNVTIMIVLQTVPPYLPMVVWWTPEDLQNGKYKYRNALQTVIECTEKGLWPGFDSFAESGNHGLIEMTQPEWAKKELHPVDIDE